MKIYEYESYDEYIACQIDGNMRKLNCSYVDPNSIKMVVDYVVNDLKLVPKDVLCHGTRRGYEMRYFSDAFANHSIEIGVLGTELSPTANRFANTIQWDFHDVKEEWVSSIDIVYSNSFDHSPKPEECLKAWMSCVSPNGVCILEYSEECDLVCTKMDPFSGTIDDYKELIDRCGFKLKAMLRNDTIPDLGQSFRGKRIFFLIQAPLLVHNGCVYE